MGEAAEEQMVVDAENCWKEILRLQQQDKSQGELAKKASAFNSSKQGQIAYSLALGLQQKLREDHNDNLRKFKDILNSLAKVNSPKLLPRITSLTSQTLPTDLPSVTANGPIHHVGMGSVFDHPRPIASASVANFKSGPAANLGLTIRLPITDTANTSPQPKMKLGLTMRGATFVQPRQKFTLNTGNGATYQSIELSKTTNAEVKPQINLEKPKDEPKPVDIKVDNTKEPHHEHEHKPAEIKGDEVSQHIESIKNTITEDPKITTESKQELKVKQEPAIEVKVIEAPKDEKKKINEESKQPALTVKEEPQLKVTEVKKVQESIKSEIKGKLVAQPKVGNPKIKSSNTDIKPKAVKPLASPKLKEEPVKLVSQPKLAEPKVKPINTDIKPKEAVKPLISPKVKGTFNKPKETDIKPQAKQKPEAKQPTAKGKAPILEQTATKVVAKTPVKNPTLTEDAKSEKEVPLAEMKNQIKSDVDENKDVKAGTPITNSDEGTKVTEVIETTITLPKQPEEKLKDVEQKREDGNQAKLEVNETKLEMEQPKEAPLQVDTKIVAKIEISAPSESSSEMIGQIDKSKSVKPLKRAITTAGSYDNDVETKNTLLSASEGVKNEKQVRRKSAEINDKMKELEAKKLDLGKRRQDIEVKKKEIEKLRFEVTSPRATDITAT